jgi:hypothetical protein
MDNVQKVNYCTNEPSSQTFRSCYRQANPHGCNLYKPETMLREEEEEFIRKANM